MKPTFGRGALLVTFAVLAADQAHAIPINDPPPAGPVVLDLNGTAIPHSYQGYSTTFFATTTSSYISFAFREDPAFLLLSNVSVTTGGGSSILVNGNFAGPAGAQAPTGWTYLNTFGASFGGSVQSGTGSIVGTNAYIDGAVQAYDSITQLIPTTVGSLYTITFSLTDDGGLSTFSQISTNGNTTDTGGNGADLLVYAGTSEPTAATPLPAALPLYATGVGVMALFGWRRKRKASAVHSNRMA